MPSYAPRRLEPYKKRNILEKRIDSLRHAVKSGEVGDRLRRCAKRVRAAMLGLVKSRRSIIGDCPASLTGLDAHPDGEALKRQLAKLDCEEERWLSIDVDEIIATFGQCDEEDASASADKPG